LGADNHRVFGDWLGHDETELDELAKTRVI
jgi:hypothetical protein